MIFLAAPDFHWIPSNIPCKSRVTWCWMKWQSQNSMELSDISFGGTRVPWNSMDYSMEFHGTKLYFIWRYQSSMEFHGNFPWNSMQHLRHLHTMDMLWNKFQWILPLYMKPISFQSKASVVCSVTAAIYIDFCLKKLNVFSQHVGQKTNEYLNSSEQIPRNWNVDQLSMLITS